MIVAGRSRPRTCHAGAALCGDARYRSLVESCPRRSKPCAESPRWGKRRCRRLYTPLAVVSADIRLLADNAAERETLRARIAEHYRPVSTAESWQALKAALVGQTP